MFTKGFRGQSGMELILALALLIMVFYITILFSMDRISQSQQMKTAMDARRIGTSVKDNIDMIVQQGEGYWGFFSVPARIHGGFDYDIFIGDNILEVSWDGGAYSTMILASNVTVHCISRGVDRENRVMRTSEGVYISCHLPNLMIKKGSLDVDLANNRTRVELMNDAHVGCGGFWVNFHTNGTDINMTYDGLAPMQSVDLVFNASQGDYVRIVADYRDELNESVKSDNILVWTI
jgi:hypothetical protein